MTEYLFLDENTAMSKEEIIAKYNGLIELIWELRHKITELDENYEILLKAYEDVSNELYG